MKKERKAELFDAMFEYIVNATGSDATEVLVNLGMTTNEIDDCAGVQNRGEIDDEETCDFEPDASLWIAICKQLNERTNENPLYGYDIIGDVIFCPDLESANAVAAFLSALCGLTMQVTPNTGFDGYTIYPE